MTGKDVLRYHLESNQRFVQNYVSDLSDADLLVRPAPGANHIAWQWGHLIGSENNFFGPKIGSKPIELPAGFAQKHGKETAGLDSPKDFYTKQEYLDLYNRVRAESIAALDRLSDADLDKPTDWQMADTVGKVFAIIGNHDLMHGGQFTVVRRKLNKPVLF